MPVPNFRVKIRELPDNMKLHRAIFTQARLMNDARNLGYDATTLNAAARKLDNLKAML